MNQALPTWALRAATAEDQDSAQAAHRHGRMYITWPPAQALRIWAKHNGWATPLFGFEDAFIATMLNSPEHFALAITKSGIEIHIPKQEYTISDERVRELDALYESRSAMGYPDSWGGLVEALRAIRRAIEAGVVVHVEGGQPMRDWQHFYQWAHGRYHMLEDGYDKWIGDDA